MTQHRRIEKLEIESGINGQQYFTDHPVERHLATKAGFDRDNLTHHQALKCGCSGWLASHYPEQFNLSSELIKAGAEYLAARDSQLDQV